MTQALEYAAKPDEISCAICQRNVKSKKCKPLYGVMVCKRDLNRFVGRRQMAYLIDIVLFYIFAILVGVLEVMFFPTYATGVSVSLTSEDIIFSIINYLGLPLLFCLKDGFNGKSPGKALCGLRVLDQNSMQPIGFAQSFKRNLPLNVPFVVLIAAIQMNKGPRLGDSWANTKVVWNKFKHTLPFDQRGVVCASCGYDLTGNVSGRCPECGTPVITAPQAGSFAAVNAVQAATVFHSARPATRD